MKNLKKRFFLGLSVFAALGSVSCDKVGSKKKPKESRAIEPLAVSLDKSADGYLLKIGSSVEKAARIECVLDSKVVSPCHDQAVFQFQEERVYHLVVSAYDQEGKFAEGAANVQVVKERVAASTNSLSLRLKDSNWTNGAPRRENEALELALELPNNPNCEKGITFEHRRDKVEGSVPVINRDAKIKTKVALGKQGYWVQARCGDIRGEPLELTWFGVPEGYQPLMLRVTKADVFGLSLVNESDCPAGLLQLECARDAGEYSAAQCRLRGMTIALSETGLKVRAKCAASTGPVLSLP